MTWEHEVVALNTATESTNRMHDDSVAATYGFRGGLVPGVDVWAYLIRPCVDRWGPEFLERGALEARFAAPVYDGERVVARLDDDGTLACTGDDGSVRATGRASLPDDVPPVRTLPSAERPDPVPPATAELLAPGTVLGTLRFRHRADPTYLADVRDDSPLYAGGAIAHPGLLARQANHVLAASVRLGPWIHVSTRARHRGQVRDGDEVEVRGVVRDEREHKGHRFVDLDVEITANGRPVWSAAHTAIWQPRRERS
jgi:acyl dehydratase